MTAGSIDDKLGPEGELEKLRRRSALLDTYISTMGTRPVYRAGVPFGAGISQNGQFIYLDSRLDTVINGVDVGEALATHEQIEWALREYLKIGEDYEYDPRGHRLANRAEYEVVTLLFPDLEPQEAWDLYDEFIDPQIRKIEGEDLSNCPSDLATYPYEHDKALMEKIREAQHSR
jgi:hypothetical protein